VIGQDGLIHHVFSSQLRPDQHIQEALDVVDRLAGINNRIPLRG
jgi:peroxiredoxin